MRSICAPQRLRLLAIALTALFVVACSKDPGVAKREYLKSGDDYAAQGKLKEAILQDRNAVVQDARFGEARFKLAQLLEKSGDPQGAYGEYVRAADLLPNDFDAQMKAASMNLRAGRFEDARARADKALALKPTAVDARLLRGNALAGLKDLDGAVQEVQEAIKADPERSLTYADLGSLQAARGDLAKAEMAFKQAVELAPTAALPRLALANFYWASGKRDLSEKTLKEALAIEPMNPTVNRALAYLYLSLRRIKDAEAPLKIVADAEKDGSARMVLAEVYRVTGRVPLAYETLDAAAEDSKVSSLAQARKATLLYTEGKKKDAYAMVDAALAKNAKDSVLLLAKAQLLTRDNDSVQALDLAKSAAAAAPTSIDARFAVGRLQATRGQSDEAISTYKELVTLAPKFWPAQLELARVYSTIGQHEEALRYADQALTIQPGNADAVLIRARALLAKGDARGAEAPLRGLSASFPGSSAVQAQLGTLFAQRGDCQAARAAYERALTGNPLNFDALGGLTRLDLADKNGPKALARIEALLSKHQDLPSLLLLEAGVHLSLGNTSRAEELARRTVAVEPSNVIAYGFLGQMYAATGRTAEAIKQFTAAAKQKPSAVEFPTMVGVLLELEGKRNDAIPWYQQALDINKQAAVAANNLAMIYADSGTNLDVALELAQTAKAQLPDLHQVSDTLGVVYVKKGLDSLAIAPLLQAVTADPRNPEYQYHLGLAYAGSGNSEKARAAYEKSLALDSTSPRAAEVRQALNTRLYR